MFRQFSNPKTAGGKSYHVVVSALSKSVRRGREAEALWCAFELLETFANVDEETLVGNERTTFKNYRTRFRGRLVVACLEDHTPSAPWLVALAESAYVGVRDDVRSERTRFAVQRAVVAACRAPKSRLLQHIRNVGDDSDSHPAVKAVRAICQMKLAALKREIVVLRAEHRGLCREVMQSNNRDRTAFVVAACALFKFAAKEGLVSDASTDLEDRPAAAPAEPPWDDRPEIFDMHVPASEAAGRFANVRDLRTNRGFVEREEGACRLREHETLAQYPLTRALRPKYDAWRFSRDSKKK